jgi:hypothetical protein
MRFFPSGPLAGALSIRWKFMLLQMSHSGMMIPGPHSGYIRRDIVFPLDFDQQKFQVRTCGTLEKVKGLVIF